MLPSQTTIIQYVISTIVYKVQIFTLEDLFGIKMELGYFGKALELPTVSKEKKKILFIEILKILGLAFAVQNVLLCAGKAIEKSGNFITNYFGEIFQGSVISMALKEYVYYFKLFCAFLPIVMVLYYTVMYTIENMNRARTRKMAAAFISMGAGVLVSFLMIGNYLILHSDQIRNISMAIFGKTPSLIILNFLIFYIYSIAESICLARNMSKREEKIRRNKRSLVMEGIYLFILALSMSIATVYVGMSVGILLSLFRSLTKKVSKHGVDKTGTIIS
ncbi:hypothetical protein NEMIN01_2091 [Nematocida minor]|uniref:uncharacterized protein n=1 Tax=Nematocida minor TaxID=1912983 RepID=UPI0022208797|nr:uncharacterized protein NEMIN01_2091 [Nematocida minor]KAI5192578.1 hypothetical protein NEMIN01_2091 [Nematocida minor]